MCPTSVNVVGMTHARTTEEIIADGANPTAAAQQAQLEAWIARHGLKRSSDELFDGAILADYLEAFRENERLDVARELPARRPGRAAKIAAIYMFAHWLIEHADVPVPDAILATYGPDMGDEVDQATRYAQIESLADQLDVRDYGRDYGDRSPQFDYVVADDKVHGIEIVYRGTTFSNDYYERKL